MPESNVITQAFSNFMERFTQFVGVIQSDHAYIHDGIGFSGLIETGSISAAYYIAFTTPAASTGKYVHLRPATISSDANSVKYVLYEGDTFTGGTAVTAINKNRNSSTAAATTVKKGVTTTPAGDIIAGGIIGSGGRPQSTAGGATGSEHEIVLKPDTDYILSLNPAGATNVFLDVFWYEEGTGV